MIGKKIFPQHNGILHGGDYNPEQWLDRPDILAEDIRLMKEAGMTSVTLGVFSWSTYEPREGEFHFEWLVDIIDKLYQNGIYTILATPTGARPAWMDLKYPDCMRVDEYGVRYHHGVRHNHCMSAPIYREKVEIILNKLIEAAGHHPGVIMWHISNEFGGECFCPHCVKRFQNYLADKFDHDIDKLNKAWWTTFWSHTYNDFSQVEPPYKNGESCIMGLNLEWRRFTTWSMTDYMKHEINILKKATPELPVTTNFMQLHWGLDYHMMAKELDVVSWDSYPAFHNDSESFTDTMIRNSFDHAVMRSMKRDQPFMLMESAPGLVNWHPYNKMKRPGVHHLACMQALACGSDTVQYFQWRKGRGSSEQYHGAVLDHLGRSDTRIFKEVAQVGEDLKKLSDLQGSVYDSKAAILFDWDTRWAIDDMRGLSNETKHYPETCLGVYRNLTELGVDCDIIPQTDDFSNYKLVVAPMLYMLKPGVADRLKAFVEAGGTLVGTYLTGYVDQNTLCFLGGFPGDGLHDLFGVISEEIDTLYPSDQNYVNFKDGKRGLVKDYAEMLINEDAEVLATYENDYYAKTPAVTCKVSGKGKAYYVAARLDADTMKSFLRMLCIEQKLEVWDLPSGVETHVRKDGDKSYRTFQNYTEDTLAISGFSGEELLSGKSVIENFTIERYGTKVLKNIEK